MERCFPVSYFLVFIWSVVVLVGMVGWGQVADLVVSRDLAKTVGWGLHAVWGIAVFLFLGAWMEVVGLCNQVGITLLVGLGFGMAIWRALRRPRLLWETMLKTPRVVWLSFVAIVPIFGAGISKQSLVNEFDDFPAYFSFCEKLMATGSVDEPFSWRRLASLGGHTLLQSSVLANGSWTSIQAFELAICPVILMALILGFRNGILVRSPLGVLIAFAAVTTPIIRVNTASHMTGVILFLGLFSTLDLIEQTEGSRRPLWLLAGAIAAGICSLRAQYIPAACGALFIFWALSWSAKRRFSPEIWKELGLWAGGLLLFLLPWIMMSMRWEGSPLFPFFPGNNNALYNPPVSELTLRYRLSTIGQMIVYPALLPLFVSLLAAPFWRRAKAAVAVFGCAVAASVLIAFVILPPDDKTVPRYVQPMMLSGALAMLMTGASTTGRKWRPAVATIFLLCLNLPERGSELVNQCNSLFWMSGMKFPSGFHSYTIVLHQKAQELVPAGKRILVCSSTPFVFDFRRNPLWIIDIPHAASPPPGLPYQKPPEETKRYLRSLGVEYVIYPSFSVGADLYNRFTWEKLAQRGVPLLKTQAQFSADFFDTFERLAASETKLGRVGNFTVVQLNP